MATYYPLDSREWKPFLQGVLVSDLHRYARGGGAALFKLEPGALLPEHGHPTGEHGYVIEGTGVFGDQSLSAGDAFWMEEGDTHAIRATSHLVFFAMSLPRPM